jgi:hypothetical protein
MYAVLGILFILVVIYFMTQKSSQKPKEGFDVSPVGQPDNLNIPPTIKPPPPVIKTEPLPSVEYGSLPSAPYQQLARNSPKPYQDPSLIKTTASRIKSAVEMLKGFLAFQANEIEYRSDPSIQLPLTTARADFQRLSDELNVISRNPGLQPDMTEKELNEIMSNLAYLQREVELIGVNRPFENKGLQNLEGFENPTPGNIQQPQPNGTEQQQQQNQQQQQQQNQQQQQQQNQQQKQQQNQQQQNQNNQQQTPTDVNVQNMNRIGIRGQNELNEETANDIIISGADLEEPPTLEDLKAFSSRLQGEMMRLSASGTTDPIMNARITALTNMKNKIDQLILQLESGALMTTDIPFKKADIVNALPALGKPNEPLPAILQTFDLPMGLSNMLPSIPIGDQEGEQDLKKLITDYFKEFLQGITATIGVGVKYTSQRDAEAETLRNTARIMESTVALTGFPSKGDLLGVADGNTMTYGGEYNSRNVSEDPKNPKAVLDAAISNGRSSSDPYAGDPRVEGRKPGHFDWKARAKHIDDQIRRRGIPEKAVGLMPRGNQVGPEFSWKGYAQMICSRLQANYDSGMAQACGCPPGDWKGW